MLPLKGSDKKTGITVARKGQSQHRFSMPILTGFGLQSPHKLNMQHKIIKVREGKCKAECNPPKMRHNTKELQTIIYSLLKFCNYFIVGVL